MCKITKLFRFLKIKFITLLPFLILLSHMYHIKTLIRLLSYLSKLEFRCSSVEYNSNYEIHNIGNLHGYSGRCVSVDGKG